MGNAVAKCVAGNHFDLLIKRYDQGPAQKALIHYSGGQVAVVGQSIYWIEDWTWTSIPKRLQPRLQGGIAYMYTYPPCSRLMVSSSGGGTKFTGYFLEQNASIKAGGQGVYWVENSQDAARRTLCYLKAGSKKLVKQPACKAISPPLEFGENLYWLESAGVTTNENRRGTVSEIAVKRSSPDFSKVTTLGTWKTSGIPALQVSTNLRFMPNGQNLYLLATGCASPVIKSGTKPGPQLYEVSADVHNGLTRVLSLPEKSRVVGFDDGYCYYCDDEDRENWWDWSGEGLRPKQVTVLFRRRLRP